MEKRLIELYQRRGQLIERIALQRTTLAREMAPVRVACDATDGVLAMAHESAGFVQRHALGVAAFAAALFAMKPRRVWHWLRRGFLVWRGWVGLRGQLQRWWG
jgi:YqjK-like protein